MFYSFLVVQIILFQLLNLPPIMTALDSPPFSRWSDLTIKVVFVDLRWSSRYRSHMSWMSLSSIPKSSLWADLLSFDSNLGCFLISNWSYSLASDYSKVSSPPLRNTFSQVYVTTSHLPVSLGQLRKLISTSFSCLGMLLWSIRLMVFSFTLLGRFLTNRRASVHLAVLNTSKSNSCRPTIYWMYWGGMAYSASALNRSLWRCR